MATAIVCDCRNSSIWRLRPSRELAKANSSEEENALSQENARQCTRSILPTFPSRSAAVPLTCTMEMQFTEVRLTSVKARLGGTATRAAPTVAFGM